MRFWLLYLTAVIFLTSVGSLLLFQFFPGFSSGRGIISPLPPAQTLAENQEVRMLDLWRPLIERIYGDTGRIPVVTAKAALLYDLETNRTLYEKESRTRFPMASLTKIMTAIVAIEHKRDDDKYVVYPENLVGEDSMGIQPGEIFSLKELLYGLMLRSGNDAAEVLASNYPEGREAFILAMNKKATALGLTDTQFSNPSGLQGDGIQHTTAQDLLVITKYAIDHFSDFREVAASATHIVEATNTHGEYIMENETNLLTTYPGVKGIKTGYTPEAGMCLVTYLDYKGHKIIGILLNSENRRQEMKELLDYSLLSLSVTPPAHE